MSQEESQILFFPLFTLVAACLVLLAFREMDLLSLDTVRMSSKLPA